MVIPDHLTCLLRNLWADQEATVRTDWFKISKGVRQGCLLKPCLFNLYAEHIMRKARLDELQARIKIGGRNNNLRWMVHWEVHPTSVDDTALIAESKEELKNLLMKVKE